MPALGLSHYNLRAPRPLMDALCAFYVDVVGLEVGPRPPFDSFGYWLYAGRRAVLHLSLAAPGEDRRTDARTTFDHTAFDCTGLGQFETTLMQRGLVYRTARVPGTPQVQLFFRDPAGNGVELNFANADS